MSNDPSQVMRLSARCHDNLKAIADCVGRPKREVVETLSAGGVRAYIEGREALAEEAARAEAEARAEDLALEDEAR